MYLHTGNLLADGDDLVAALQWYGKAITVLGPVSQSTPVPVEAGEDLCFSHWAQGRALARLNRKGEALSSYQAARAVAERLVRDHPHMPDYAADLARKCHDLAQFQAQLRRHSEALKSYEAARALWEALARDDRRYCAALADTLHALAGLQAQLKKRGEAIQSYTAARALEEQLVRDHPKVSYYAARLAHGCNELGILHAALDQRAEAREAYEAARVVLERLVREHRDAPDHAVALGGTYCNLGHLLKSDDLDSALPWYGKAIATLEPLSQRQPPPARARLFLGKSYWGRFDALRALGRHAEALKDLDQLLALQVAEQPALRLERAATLARLGEHAQAAAAAAELAALTKVSARFVYDLARAYSLCVPAAGKDARLSPGGRDQAASTYAARAVALLRRAAQAGFRDVAHMQKDTALDPLRQRADFKKLIAELEGK
jgi:tetratricopeptide (TPR) repeat protein